MLFEKIAFGRSKSSSSRLGQWDAEAVEINEVVLSNNKSIRVQDERMYDENQVNPIGDEIAQSLFYVPPRPAQPVKSGNAVPRLV